jgi:uncharacterized protein (TIGR02246 family)
MKFSQRLAMAKVGPSLAIILAIASGCNERPKLDLAAEEAVIRKTDAAWLAAATAHDLERTLPFWSDDATILSPGAPAIVGKQAIRNYVSGAFATAGFSIAWKTEKIEVAQSGDMAYSTGTERISFTSADGKPVVADGRSIAVWRRQPDGSWKCVMDVMSPAPAANAK